MTIQIVHDDFVAALVDLRRVGDELRAARGAAERSVDVLLDGSWSGAASRGYLEGWEQWVRGCAEVLAGLDTMTELLDLARRGLVTQDDCVATTFGGAP